MKVMFVSQLHCDQCGGGGRERGEEHSGVGGGEQQMKVMFVCRQSRCDQRGGGGGGQETHLDGGCRICEYLYLFFSHLTHTGFKRQHNLQCGVVVNG